MSGSTSSKRAFDPRLGKNIQDIAERSGERTPSKTRESAASHTYDKGYQKWASFDAEKAIREVDQEDDADASFERTSTEEVTETRTPSGAKTNVVSVPSSSTSRTNEDDNKSAVSRTDEERERGNRHFKRGEFQKAITLYTRAIAADPRSVAAYANRAMAHLKLSDYRRALTDCNTALKIDSRHVKCLLRRGMASNGLGCHRAALRDLVEALRISPRSKTLKSELRKTRDFVRTSARRSPRMRIPVHVTNEDESDLPPIVSVENENETSSNSKRCDVVGEEESVEKSVETAVVEDSKSVVVAKRSENEVATSSVSEKETKSPAVITTKSTPRRVAHLTKEKSRRVVPPPPKTGYEFVRAWKTMRGNSCQRSEYLKRMQPERMHRVFQNALESDLFMEIVSTISEHAESWTPHSRVVDFFVSLSTVKRFDMIVMFLSESDKKLVVSLLEHAGVTASPADKATRGLLKKFRK